MSQGNTVAKARANMYMVGVNRKPNGPKIINNDVDGTQEDTMIDPTISK